MIRIYSKTHPEGMLRKPDTLHPEALQAIETTGVYRGTCPCCDLPVVIRMAEDRPNMTAGDEHFLLHGLTQ